MSDRSTYVACMYARGSGLAGVRTRLSGGFGVAAFAGLELKAYFVALCLLKDIFGDMRSPLWDPALLLDNRWYRQLALSFPRFLAFCEAYGL